MTFTIDYKITGRDSLNTIYSCKHWTQRKKYADTAHKEIWWEMLRSLGALSSYSVFSEPVAITVTYPPDNIDIDNHALVCKIILDCIKGKIIPDDSPKYVRRVTQQFGDVDKITVEMEEVEC